MNNIEYLCTQFFLYQFFEQRTYILNTVRFTIFINNNRHTIKRQVKCKPAHDLRPINAPQSKLFDIPQVNKRDVSKEKMPSILVTR